MLDLAAEKSGWDQPLPKGSGRGVSVQNVFGSYMAQVAEVAVSKDGDVAVKRITCAVDCGIGINPNTIEAQAQSAIVYGLTAVLCGEITLKDGRVEQSNFDNYRALRINEIPAIDIHIIDSGEAPGGMGEPGTCAVPPAVTNAIFAATGVRLRKLPIVRPSSRLDRALLAKLGPAVEPLLHLGLVPVSRGCVEGLALHAVREVVLARERLLVVMIVGIAATVTFLLHQFQGNETQSG